MSRASFQLLTLEGMFAHSKPLSQTENERFDLRALRISTASGLGPLLDQWCKFELQ